MRCPTFYELGVLTVNLLMSLEVVDLGNTHRFFEFLSLGHGNDMV